MKRAGMHQTIQALKELDESFTGHAGNSAHSNRRAGIPFDIPEIDGCLGGGLIGNALHEVRCSHTRDIATASGFVIALLTRLADGRRCKILWIADPATSVDGGTLFPDGLAQYGFDPALLTIVNPVDLHTAMWAADEAAGCGGLAATIFQVKGNPARFDMTATRRLMLRARENRTFVCVLRQCGEQEASAAATRWHVAIQPSNPDGDYERGLGRAGHVVTLERNRNGRTGQWSIAWNPKTRAFENAVQNISTAHFIRGVHPFTDRPDRPDQMGQIMDIGRAS